jgi:hypothetical protein
MSTKPASGVSRPSTEGWRFETFDQKAWRVQALVAKVAIVAKKGKPQKGRTKNGMRPHKGQKKKHYHSERPDHFIIMARLSPMLLYLVVQWCDPLTTWQC